MPVAAAFDALISNDGNQPEAAGQRAEPNGSLWPASEFPVNEMRAPLQTVDCSERSIPVRRQVRPRSLYGQREVDCCMR